MTIQDGLWFDPAKLFIAGGWRAGGGGETIPVENPSTGEKLAEVACAIGGHVDDAVAAARADQRLADDRPVLGLCPGSEFGPSKRWPEHHYAAVAQHWIEHGGQVWIFGSGKDQPVADTIVEMLENSADEHAVVLAGNTSLEQAVDLLSATTAVVSNDSGLMHIAAALKRPLVAVYGSPSPGFSPPLGDRVAVVRLGLECSPCFERECPLGHLNCLRQLPPSQVIDALQQLESADA